MPILPKHCNRIILLEDEVTILPYPHWIPHYLLAGWLYYYQKVKPKLYQISCILTTIKNCFLSILNSCWCCLKSGSHELSKHKATALLYGAFIFHLLLSLFEKSFSRSKDSTGCSNSQPLQFQWGNPAKHMSPFCHILVRSISCLFFKDLLCLQAMTLPLLQPAKQTDDCVVG